MSYNSKYTGAEVEALLDLASTRASQEDLNLAIERIDDLASEKQDEITDLDTIRANAAKGATALQSYTEQYKGTVTGVKINGTTKTPSDGIVDLGEINGSTSDYTFAFDYDKNGCKYVNAKIGNTGNDWNDTVYIPLLHKSDDGSSSQLIQGCNGIDNGTTTLRFLYNELRAESIYSNGPNFTITSNGDGKQFLCNDGKYKNLKTINGQSILGSGNITIEGGAGGDFLPLTGGTIDGDLYVNGAMMATEFYGQWVENNGMSTLSLGRDKIIYSGHTGNENNKEILFNGDGTKFLANDGTYKEVSGVAYPKTMLDSTVTALELIPNTFYVWGEVTMLDLELGPERPDVTNEYLFQFTSGSTSTTLTLPDYIKWANGNALTIKENHIYQVSIVNNLGIFAEFYNPPAEEPSIFPMYLTTPDSGIRPADEDSLALLEYIKKNALITIGNYYDCIIPSNSLYIDGHEVHSFGTTVSGSNLETSDWEWWFEDDFDYGYRVFASKLYGSGANKGAMARWDDD